MNHHYESDPDIVFDKDAIFSAFCSKCCFSIYKTYPHSNVNLKKMKLELYVCVKYTLPATQLKI